MASLNFGRSEAKYLEEWPEKGYECAWNWLSRKVEKLNI
jgi:hypothetical protein